VRGMIERRTIPKLKSATRMMYPYGETGREKELLLLEVLTCGRKQGADEGTRDHSFLDTLSREKVNGSSLSSKGV